MTVSIIIPCYNQGSYLNEALESVYRQTIADWECIIVDDGSTDYTKKIAEEWVEKDKRFAYYYKENGGVSSARNYGIQKASGSYLQFLDCDDLLHDTKLEVSLEQIKAGTSNKVKMVISNFNMISADSKTISPAFCRIRKEHLTLNAFLFQWNKTFSIQIQCGLFAAALFREIRFPENLSAQEDWLVWIQLMKTECELVFVDKPLAFYRVNPESRMRTVGIDDNQIKMLANFKEVLSAEEYQTFCEQQLEDYYTTNKKLRRRLQNVKKSNSYQTGLMVKKIIRKVGLLKPARSLFHYLLKFKAK